MRLLSLLWFDGKSRIKQRFLIDDQARWLETATTSPVMYDE